MGKEMLLAFLLAICVSLVSSCGFPGSPANAKVITTDKRFMEGTVVTIECDPGYILLGRSMLRCVNSEWDSRGLPFCVREIAFLKPSGMSSRNQSSNLAVDDQSTTCAETDSERKHSWWVDLIAVSSIHIIEIRSGTDLSNLSMDISVEDPKTNTTTTCYSSENVALPGGPAQYFLCNQTTFGRKLTLNVSAPKSFNFKLCEIKVYSQGVLSPQDACGTESNGKIETLEGQCYEVTPIESSFDEAETFCVSQGGTLWTGDQPEFVLWMMNVHNLDSVWYQRSETTTNSTVTNCTAFTRDYQVEDRNQENTTCTEVRFGICVRPPLSCGKPRLPKHLAFWDKIEKVSPGETLSNLTCETGFHLSGPSSYRCMNNGKFQIPKQQLATTCRQSMCGKPPIVPNAFPVIRTESRYYCINDSFVLYGNPVLKCDPIKSRWSTPHAVCVRLSTSTTFTIKSLRERLLQGADLFPVATKVGLFMFILTLIILKILMAMALVNIIRYYRVVKPKLKQKHNSSIMLSSMHDELSRADPCTAVGVSDENHNNLNVNGNQELDLSSGDAQVVIRTTGSSTPKAPETPKMRLNESSIREHRTE